jgi:AcrR family transcriptional regulator
MVAAKPLTDSPPRPSRLAGAPPGPRQRDQRQGALLDAAAALFVEKGVMATSIDDIVVRAGVAKGTFYHYFHDRAAMLEALRRRYSQNFADAAQAAMGARDAEDWHGQLDAWIGTVVREYLASYALHDAIFHDPAICHRCVMGEEPVVQNLAALIGSGRQAGVWDTDDALATAVFMFHGVHGMLDETIATGADTAGVAPRLSRLFANMLRPL